MGFGDICKLGKEFNLHFITVVRECCKGGDASQWKSSKFDPHHAETGVTKIGRRDYVVDVITSATPVQKFVTVRPSVLFPRMRDFARQIAHQNVLVFLVCISSHTRTVVRHSLNNRDAPLRTPLNHHRGRTKVA